jgi:tetraacyldisaccharide 4'-kinase
VTPPPASQRSSNASGGLARRIEAGWSSGRPPPLTLRLLAGVFAAVVAVRRRLYRAGWFSTTRLPVPVVVVGNRVVGGAGKTPTTLALIDALRQLGWTPGVVSRGHGGSGSNARAVLPDSLAADVGDEPVLLARRSGVPVWVARDRGAAGRALLAAHPDVDLLLCDDGLQHLALARDVEVIVFDERGAGNGCLLPAGPLREAIDSPSATGEPGLVVYNATQPTTALPGHVVDRRLAGAVELPDWWRGVASDPGAWGALQVPPAPLLCAGIGQPQRLVAMLSGVGVTVQLQPLADHFDFAELPWPTGTLHVIVTEKDAVKLDPARVARERPGTRVWVVPLRFELPGVLLDELAGRLTTRGFQPRRPRPA